MSYNFCTDSYKVSVIVPVYNAEKYILRCAKSIQDQSINDIEIILVDDGTSDESGRICDGLACVDNRVTVIHQKNEGASFSRNQGVKIASGNYIIFVDSDDYIDSQLVESMMANESDLTMCGIKKVTESGDVLSEIRYGDIYYPKNQIDYKMLASCGEIYSPYCKLFRRSIIESNRIEFPRNYSWGEDGMFVADYIRYVTNIRYISYVGYYYVRYSNENTLSTSVRPDVIDMIVTSRLYFKDSLIKAANRDSIGLAEIVDQNIKKNCADYTKRLLDSRIMTKEQKIETLDLFRKNSYVKAIINDPNAYFSDPTMLCLKKGRSRRIINTYNWLIIKRKAERIIKKFCKRVRALYGTVS